MSKNKILIIYIVLAVATLIAFWQVNYCDFINYDDVPYISQNSHIQNGITMESIRWAFTTGYQANWHPLTWISHMLDIQLFGLNPHWHHIMNLLFHIANTLLLFFVLNRMTKRIWQCAFVAALFALHPLHVESVAWLAERKDVLSTFFWIFTMGAYCYYVERPGLRRYLPVLIFFVLGLMAKPMLVTLPFVLLLLDYWPLRRFGQIISDQEIQTKSNNSIFSEIRKGKSKGKNTITVKEEIKAERSTDSNYRWALLRPLLWEKIPLFVLAVLSSVVTFVAQQRWGAMVSIEKLPLSARISNTFISYIIYIEKMIWPNNLSIFYPYSRHWQLWQVMVAAFILIAITFLVIRAAKRLQYLAVGWLWYVGTLVPVIGLVQVGEQSKSRPLHLYPPDEFQHISAAGKVTPSSSKSPVSCTSPSVIGTCAMMVLPILACQMRMTADAVMRHAGRHRPGRYGWRRGRRRRRDCRNCRSSRRMRCRWRPGRTDNRHRDPAWRCGSG